MSKKPKKLEVAKPLDAEQIAQEKIPQEMFEQVAGEKIYDQQMEGEAIGFFKDAYLRFKKNKAAIGAAWIILFIILMAIFAPIPFPRTAYQLWNAAAKDSIFGKSRHRRRLCHNGYL